MYSAIAAPGPRGVAWPALGGERERLLHLVGRDGEPREPHELLVVVLLLVVVVLLFTEAKAFSLAPPTTPAMRRGRFPTPPTLSANSFLTTLTPNPEKLYTYIYIYMQIYTHV